MLTRVAGPHKISHVPSGAMQSKSIARTRSERNTPAAALPVLYPEIRQPRGARNLLDGSLLGRIRAVVLLGGSVTRVPLSAATGRTLLELPLESGRSILDDWQRHVSELACLLERDSLTVRLLLERSSLALPFLLDPRVDLRVEHDPRPYRGTGGLLRDLAEEYDDDDVLLVGSAAQVLIEPLPDLVRAMAVTGADVCVVSHADGTPSSLLLVRCACLRLLPRAGFVDLKEQGLAMISAKHRGSVIYRRMPYGLPVRDMRDYLVAVMRYHRSRAGALVGLSMGNGNGANGNGGSGGPFEEGWSPSFAIVEDGADVDRNAQIHDSIVLRGGRVDSRSFVVRSIVCPGGVVRARRTVVNQLVR